MGKIVSTAFLAGIVAGAILWVWDTTVSPAISGAVGVRV